MEASARTPDQRAGTPSIAAEIAVPVMSDLVERISNCSASLVSSLRSKGEYFAQRLDNLADGLASALALSLSAAERRLERVSPALSSSLAMRLQADTARLDRVSDRLRLLSPYGVLERGYSLTTTADGAVVRDASSLSEGAVLRTRFANGEAESTVARLHF